MQNMMGIVINYLTILRQIRVLFSYIIAFFPNQNRFRSSKNKNDGTIRLLKN